jgi:hypothetical protein
MRKTDTIQPEISYGECNQILRGLELNIERLTEHAENLIGCLNRANEDGKTESAKIWQVGLDRAMYDLSMCEKAYETIKTMM